MHDRSTHGPYQRDQGGTGIARYTEQTEADLAWGEIRREVEYRLNLAAAHAKMRKKNELLPALQEQFENALNQGKLLSFEQLVKGAGEWLKELESSLELYA